MNLQAITIQYVAAMVILNTVHLSICVYYLASPKENGNTASTGSGIAMPPVVPTPQKRVLSNVC